MVVRLRVDASSLSTWLCCQVQCPWARLIVHPEKMCLRDADAQVFRGRLQIIHGSDRKTQSRSLHLPDIMPYQLPPHLQLVILIYHSRTARWSLGTVELQATVSAVCLSPVGSYTQLKATRFLGGCQTGSTPA